MWTLITMSSEAVDILKNCTWAEEGEEEVYEQPYETREEEKMINMDLQDLKENIAISTKQMEKELHCLSDRILDLEIIQNTFTKYRKNKNNINMHYDYENKTMSIFGNKDLYGGIIGQRGVNINQLNKKHGVNIKIPQRENPSNRIEISGKDHSSVLFASNDVALNMLYQRK